MKVVEAVLFWIAVAIMVGIAIGRFLLEPPSVLGFNATGLITVANTILLLSILARLHSK